MKASNVLSSVSLMPVKANNSEGVAKRSGVRKARPPKLKFKGTLAYAASRMPGGKQSFMECVRIASERDESLLPLVQKWDSVSKSDRRYTNLDNLCEAVDIPPGRVLGAAAEAAFEFNADVSKLMAAAAQPLIVESTIENALTPQGVQDRRMLHQHSGFVPSPNGANININNEVNARINEGIGIPPLHETLGPIEKMIKEQMERKALRGEDQFIDVDELEEIDKRNLELVAGEDSIDDPDDES